MTPERRDLLDRINSIVGGDSIDLHHNTGTGIFRFPKCWNCPTTAVYAFATGPDGVLPLCESCAALVESDPR